MSSSYSPILRTELIGSGDQAGTWGSTTNNNFQYVFETAIAGYQAVTVSPSSNNQVLTYVNGPSSTAALNQSIYALLKLNAGTLSANFNIFAPPVSKSYTVWNNTAYTATFYNSSVIGNTSAAGFGVVVPAGAKIFIWSDGANFWSLDSTAGNFTVAGALVVSGSFSAASAVLGSALPITSGGTGVTTATGTGSLVLSASPTFTGIPAAPTATAGTDTTQIATTAFVKTAVTNATGSLGTISTQNANAVAITGGTISGATISGATISSLATALSVANGGTGAATLAANAVLLGNGASALQTVAPGAAGRLLISNGTTWTSNTLAGAGAKLGLGITGEVWNNVTGSRGMGSTYTNSYSYPIMVAASNGVNNGPTGIAIYINGNLIASSAYDANGSYGRGTAIFIVPPGATYLVANYSTQYWYELY